MTPCNVLFAAGTLLFATAAEPHAMLMRAIPAVGGQVRGSPSRVDLFFSEALEPAFSTIRVVDASGKPVDRGDKTFDPNDRSHESVSVSTLLPGEYRVRWRALSVDTHVTEGSFTFQVLP